MEGGGRHALPTKPFDILVGWVCFAPLFAHRTFGYERRKDLVSVAPCGHWRIDGIGRVHEPGRAGRVWRRWRDEPCLPAVCEGNKLLDTDWQTALHGKLGCHWILGWVSFFICCFIHTLLGLSRCWILSGVSEPRDEERGCLVSVCHYGAHIGGFPLMDEVKKDEGDEDYDCMHNEKKNFDGHCCGIGEFGDPHAVVLPDGAQTTHGAILIR